MLFDNQLTVLPAEIGNLTKLTACFFSSNQLEDKSTIELISKLEKMDVKL